MADKNNQNLSWKDLVSRISADSGIPKKNIEEVVDAVEKSVISVVKEVRPTDIGTSSKIKTPLALYKVSHLPERITTNPKTGEQFVRAACYGVSTGTPSKFVDSANSGIAIERKPLAAGKTISADKSSKKSAG